MILDIITLIISVFAFIVWGLVLIVDIKEIRQLKKENQTLKEELVNNIQDKKPNGGNE